MFSAGALPTRVGLVMVVGSSKKIRADTISCVASYALRTPLAAAFCDFLSKDGRGATRRLAQTTG